ncbi:MAG: sporulation protein YqfD [Clostridia bacterium]|nr:sporulation protein YqfD [Clostridia bacterium]
MKRLGIITRLNVQNGTALVKEGDIVKKGTMLVGGYLEGKYTGTRYVHSLADIQAKIWYSKKEKFSYNQRLKKSSEATETKYSIKINNFTINFYKTLSKFKNYDTIMESKKLNLFSNFYLPIEIIKITNSEFYYEEVIYTEEELLELAKTKLENELLEEIKSKDDIINEQVNVYKFDDGIELEIIYEVIEEIGTEEKIVF